MQNWHYDIGIRILHMHTLARTLMWLIQIYVFILEKKVVVMSNKLLQKILNELKNAYVKLDFYRERLFR